MKRKSLFKILMILVLFIPILKLSSDFSSRVEGAALNQEQKETSAPEDISPLILNNERLRRYYFREYMERFVHNRDVPRVGRIFLENWIDQQIIYNAQVMAERVETLKNDHDMGVQLLKRLSKEPDRVDMKLQVKRFFREFRDDVGDLRKKIDFVVSGLDSEPEDRSRGYSTERTSVDERMALVKQELVEAERLIRGYFLNPTHTVEVRDLEDNNMMIRLYRIERIMESLENTSL